MNLGVPFRKGFAPCGVLKKVEPLDSKSDDLLQVTDLLTTMRFARARVRREQTLDLIFIGQTAAGTRGFKLGHYQI